MNHSPTPWKMAIVDHLACIMDVDGKEVVRASFTHDERAIENIREIVDCVNAIEELNKIIRKR